ncbi:MAG: electron transfer flavoprotein subunit alpha/FixB family protein [Desulfotignum sp.]|nr:electron transfer flavoprotein subunit alpha/FixB family protein [Desulfotignum sp.]MCF8088649.1 electron transfer flavoprotein subunit alpha/FixB family protein [Desulfotignum sp.]MCF8137851.1 electron transfer flavoprotein subunit alpha/FixB family protein [Desulfotignum sp.]
MKQAGIVIEVEHNQVKETSLGMITLAGRTAESLTALVMDGITREITDQLAAHGVHTIVDLVLPDAPEIRLNPAVRAAAVVHAARELTLDRVLGLSSPEGKDLLPRVAALLDAPLVMDCVDVDLNTGLANTSQYSGKVMAQIQLTGETLVFGVRPNAVPPEPRPVQAKTVVLTDNEAVPENITLRSWDNKDSEGRQSLVEADIIIAGGRGLKNKDNFSLIIDCAEKLNAAPGASRVAVDEGWVPYAFQVGQTGEKVSPQVYIACGISGSIQHFAGMKTAKMIIAVNRDENAAIMANCDYQVPGDLFDILPEIMKQL